MPHSLKVFCLFTPLQFGLFTVEIWSLYGTLAKKLHHLRLNNLVLNGKHYCCKFINKKSWVLVSKLKEVHDILTLFHSCWCSRHFRVKRTLERAHQSCQWLGYDGNMYEVLEWVWGSHGENNSPTWDKPLAHEAIPISISLHVSRWMFTNHPSRRLMDIET